MNQARYFLPHIYALSVNSPFWVGQRHRLERLSAESVRAFSAHRDSRRVRIALRIRRLLQTAGARPVASITPKKIWWDIRLHPFFDTLEVRVCDAQSRVDDTLAIAALIQAVIAKLYKLLRQNTTFRVYRRRLAGRKSLARLALWHRRQTDRFRPRS